MAGKKRRTKSGCDNSRQVLARESFSDEFLHRVYKQIVRGVGKGFEKDLRDEIQYLERTTISWEIQSSGFRGHKLLRHRS